MCYNTRIRKNLFMINLDLFESYKTDGKGGVQGRLSLLKTKGKNTVFLMSETGERHAVSIKRLTYHQHVRKLVKGERVILNRNKEGSYLDKLTVCVNGDFNPNMQGKISLIEREAICSFYDEGIYDLAQLEKAYQLSNKSVRQILAGKTCGCDGSRIYQVQCPVGSRQGDYLKKIFDKELCEIMQMFSIGEKKSVIARWIGVTVATVTRYLNIYYLNFGEENGSNN
jgi:hypothetical protein